MYMKSVRMGIELLVWLLLFLNPVQSQEQSFPVLYFSEYSKGTMIPQLRVLDSAGQVHDVFAVDNDGYFSSLSPDGAYLAFERYDWDKPSSEAKSQVWIADLQMQQQIAVTAPKATGHGVWSPNSQILFIGQLEAVTPLWAAPNYGFHSLYRISEEQTTRFDHLSAWEVGWYSDNRHLLLWNEDTGYFKFDISNQSVEPIRFQSVDQDRFWSSAITFIENRVAISQEDGLGIYDGENGQRLQNVSQTDLGGEPFERGIWSPDGRYIALKLTGSKLAVWDYRADSLSALVDLSGLLFNTYSDQLRWSASTGDLYLLAETDSGTVLYHVNVLSGNISLIYAAAKPDHSI